MIKITICDDESVERKYLAALAEKWATARGFVLRINEFESAENFLFAYEDDKSADILLLDIQMKDMDGVELARRVRLENDLVQIIFITGYPDFMSDGYEVSALHYLMKPVKEEKLFEVLDKAATRLHKATRTVILPKTSGSIKIKADDILYAEVISHKVYVHLKNGKSEEFTLRISDMLQLLGDEFFHCHRSYIVSMKYVRRVTKKAIVLENGTEIPLSRNLYDTANQAFINYN